MLQKEIPTLISVSSLLSSRKKDIVEHWTTFPMVLEVLDKHHIDLHLFKSEYAMKILDYYFGVVEQTKMIGDCPVMADFLLYLKEHDVSADELFIICTHARKAMINLTFDLDIISKALFEEISYVFDLNFKGVLTQYANTIYRLEKQIQEEMEENRKKDAVMFQHARLAQMGEMINNIAHQWRQPLSMVSAIAQNIHFKYQFGKLDDNFMNDNIDEIKKILHQMSQTITDFQNFFHPNKEKEEFFIENSIDHTIDLLNHSMEKQDIEFIRLERNDLMHIMGYPNEFSQTFLNLFSNAKDALLANDLYEKRCIYIKTASLDETFQVSICDNAGGIPEEILDKVFNPYFTTKEQGKGTGIGLYMCKQIIEKNMAGSITVQNKTLENGEKGAEFLIELPKSECS
ncbi:HAMP domain-containing sensor histidine kinase [Sulfurovum sp.]|uniref:sensor histidine kinase n=1 Tax=Sulfurovum sp. TaxID=1969726 RepID=UPI0028682B40|nr:HAMP domain-containing sensor histidine kinase [Sulfurovum sp.]